MKDYWKNKWNERYSQEAFAYGQKPNEFLRQQLDLLSPGNILFPADGEGRNSVYAATLGWTVASFDISIEGKHKAERLASDHAVTVDYRVGELPDLAFQPGQFDVIALIYAHFPAEIKSQYHRMLGDLLRPGGTIIFEAFGKRHLEYRAQNPKVGGPRDLATLFSTEELEADFTGYEVLELAEVEVELSEGLFHNGKGSVVRFVGKKPK